jgi:uncharacterized protein (DUF111 family)
MLEGRPVYSRGPAVELTTPTGAAIAVATAQAFGALPAMKLVTSGYGAGTKDFKEQANMLRVLIGETSTAPEATTVAVIEANIDDATAQILAHALERAMSEGALDASIEPIVMKKGRPGSLLRVIARPEDQERLAQLVFDETPTLGLRVSMAERRVLEREIRTVETPWGPVRVKLSGGHAAPEFEDCKRIAIEKGIPLRDVIAAALNA